MKKRHLAVMLGLAVSFVLLLAACAPETPNTSAEEPSEQSGAELDVSPESLPADSNPSETAMFAPGTWLSDAGQYYFFDPDGVSGRTASLENGTGVGFAYTLDGMQGVFSMGAADDSSPCSVYLDGDTAVLEWEDGVTEHLTHISDLGSDSFQFYSNQELAEMSVAYYKEHSGGQDSSGLTAAAQTNGDGSVSIQVYENLGDHNITAAWYTVDRTTATGTDGSGGEIDLAS